MLAALAACSNQSDGFLPTDASDVEAEVTLTRRHHLVTTTPEREAVVIEGVSLDATRLVIDVAVRRLRPDDRVMAIGYRLRFDPTVLAFESASPGQAWATGISLASGAVPGVVVAGVAHPHPFYEEPLAPLGDHVLHRLTFSVKALAPTSLSLEAGRSRAFVWPEGDDPERGVVSPDWVGAALDVIEAP